MLDDDAVIAESWQQPERFAVLFDRPAAYIHRYLARRTDSQAAEDLVAETFLTAFRKRRRYQHGYANARPWLYGIATHLAGQHYRDLARQHRLHQAAYVYLGLCEGFPHGDVAIERVAIVDHVGGLPR